MVFTVDDKNKWNGRLDYSTVLAGTNNNGNENGKSNYFFKH